MLLQNFLQFSQLDSAVVVVVVVALSVALISAFLSCCWGEKVLWLKCLELQLLRKAVAQIRAQSVKLWIVGRIAVKMSIQQ